MREPRARLRDILETIEAIKQSTSAGRERFDEDIYLRGWVLQQCQNIGEAAAALPKDLRAQYPQVPWKKVVGLHNNIVHQYFHVDADVVWGVVQNDLPELQRTVETMLKDLDQHGDTP